MANLIFAQKDYMFEDGTIVDVMTDKKVMAAAGANCILNDYEFSAVGEMIDLAAWSAVSGAAIFKLMKFRQMGKLITKLKKYKKFEKIRPGNQSIWCPLFKAN